VYEWGALPPHAKAAPDSIVAFYVGKAGSHATNSQQTLATRFLRCACACLALAILALYKAGLQRRCHSHGIMPVRQKPITALQNS
jgi:hypothetical protein